MTKRLDKLRSHRKNLISLIKKGNYTYREVPGKNGHHYPLKREITIGKSLCITDKIIVASHEFGHAIDINSNPLGLEEATMFLLMPDVYDCTPEGYEREKRAWRYGRLVLDSLGAYSSMADRFQKTKKSCLQSYYRGVVKLRKHGYNANVDPETYQEAYDEFRNKVAGHVLQG